MASPYDPIQEVFESSIREFKNSLKDDKLYNEILKTTTIDEVYDATDRLQEEQARNGHLRHLAKIEPYLQRLKGYTGVIEIFVQVKPDILALIWGPIKLLLQWASTLKQSFDEIVDTTAHIGAILPEFEEVVKLFGHNDQIRDVLVLFFKDILDFYLIALKFFSMTRWRYFFESLWPKHRDKIKVVTTHIERHTLLMRNEVRLEHIRGEHEARLQSLEHFESTERSQRRQEYHNIKTDISPKFYEDRLDWFHGRVCEGTGRWLMRDTTFSKWLDISDTSIKLVWLQGIPGAGKTYLSSTIVDKSKSLGRTLFAFLSYTYSSSTSALSILHSLIFQLASSHDDLQAVLCQSSRENLKNNINVAMGLLSTLLECAGPVYIVVDGVDEIEEIERGRLLNRLLDLSKNCGETKILISSRQEADITALLNPNSAAIRVDNRNAGSIQAFVTRRTQDWFHHCGILPEAQSEIESLLAPLASNAKGMFLYAKIVLDSIELLNDIKEIRQELLVLPESLDDAYDRIFSRVNNLRPPVLRDKARKLLGWIGCSPTPLTIHEIEQALTANLDDLEGEAKLITNLNIVKICGPIVEVVDNRVQFVHFTVKEYVFSPRVSNFIDSVEATLSLAMCTITYLCLRYYDPALLDEEIKDNILSGAYRLHNFATTKWIELVKYYVHLSQSQPLPSELINLLELLMSERKSYEFSSETDLVAQPDLETLKLKRPDLHKMLCTVVQFHQKCTQAECHISKGDSWIYLDPLTISRTSVRIYEQTDRLLCRTKRHEKGCLCRAIERHHGQRLFKCGFLSCSFHRYGFETRSLRDSHARHHDRPWKCSVQDCEYANIGFLSRRMRDEHWGRYHQSSGLQPTCPLDDPDKDEIQPLLFDLIKVDKVAAVEAFLPQFYKIPEAIQHEMRKLAALSGSLAMLQLIAPLPKNELDGKAGELAVASIQGKNIETLGWLLSQFKRGDFIDSRILEAVLRSDSVEIYQEYENYAFDGLMGVHIYSSRVPATEICTRTVVLRATAGHPNRERLLLSLWEKLNLGERLGMKYLGDALVNVAQSTCSVMLAKTLIEWGAMVDHRRSVLYMTPLHHAARQTSAEAAELMKLLLFCGADPEAGSTRANSSVSEERGAKGISKWLHMSWDDLVAKAKEERGKGKYNRN